ncbi:uncharacterized protein LOC123267527 isoform X1 [Cotesia glomerata]|uniref:Uncharacterized protein n=1 Tax=Cotesia glomerata TaxID=32391 RepID=A0AAV7HD49_COTGL|nr:uncharacterized protein LOC123267527 isoform X1 [Cotesia glomerata]KAH0535094.1 hypothetical protein KQX54_013296 [Cotesia glomerata]
MVKIKLFENQAVRTFFQGQATNFTGFIARILGFRRVNNQRKFIFLISEGFLTRYMICFDNPLNDVLKRMELHQIVIIKRSRPRFGIIQELTNDPLVNEFRFEINNIQNLIITNIKLEMDDFINMPNFEVELESEDEN